MSSQAGPPVATATAISTSATAIRVSAKVAVRPISNLWSHRPWMLEPANQVTPVTASDNPARVGLRPSRSVSRRGR